MLKRQSRQLKQSLMCDTRAVRRATWPRALFQNSAFRIQHSSPYRAPRNVVILPLMKITWRGVFPAVTTQFRKDQDRKSTRLNSSHMSISYAVFCLKKKKKKKKENTKKANKEEHRYEWR